MANERTMLTWQAAAEYCGVSKSTLKRVVADGHLRRYRLGPRTIRFATTDLDRWLQESRDDGAAATN